MMHVTTADKSLLMGDEAAGLLLEYAALLGRRGSADTVVMRAYGADGDPVEVHFLLNSGTSILAESSDSPVDEPDNAAAVADLRDRMRLIRSPPNVQPMEHVPEAVDWEI